MLVGMVDTIFADVAQPDQARIVSLNAQHFLKNGGHFVISIKVIYIFFLINVVTRFAEKAAERLLVKVMGSIPTRRNE